MKLHKYPTPITDKHEANDNGDTAPVYDLARELERKLTLCRDDLKVIGEAFEKFGYFDEVLMFINETLELTK